MLCAWCRTPLGYVHGHAACLDGRCPMFGLNQVECCGGETAETCPAPTSLIVGTDRHDEFPIAPPSGKAAADDRHLPSP